MKKRVLSLFILFMPALLFSYTQDRWSNSFMRTRGATNNVAMEYSLWHNVIYHKKGNCASSFQVIPFYQASVNNPKTGRYFLPEDKDEISVRGDDTNDRLTRDVRAEWLNLPSDFRGGLSLAPERRETGFSVELSQDVGRLFDIEFLDGFFVSGQASLVVIEQSINLQQSEVRNYGTTPGKPQDIIEAFNQPSWRYATMPRGRNLVRPAEFQLRFGKAYIACDEITLAHYTCMVVPLCGAQNARYVFDPVVGPNGHVGFGSGVHFEMLLNNDITVCRVNFYAHLEQVFFVKNNQYRTFDLLGKPWSRYLLLNHKDGPPNQNIPAANILTREVRVSPYNFIDFNAGWRLRTSNVEFEFGYNLWAHGDEKIELLCPFPDCYGIAGTGGIDNSLINGRTATSASKSTICEQAPNDVLRCHDDEPVFISIQLCDLDFCSCSARSALTHKVHASAGCMYEGKCLDAFFGIGAFYEISQRNTALEQWGVWVKVGGSV